MIKFVVLASILALAVTAAVPAVASTTLTTPINADRSQNGVMFDVAIGAKALTLQSIGVNAAGGSVNYEFWTRGDTVVGHLLSSSGWTLRDTFSNVLGAGFNMLTSFDITDFTVAANTVLGVYFTTTTTNQYINYTNGTAVGNTLASNSDLTIKTGYGEQYAFARSFKPRNFNGSITYSAAVPEPASWGMMIVGFGLVGAATRQRRARAVAA